MTDKELKKIYKDIETENKNYKEDIDKAYLSFWGAIFYDSIKNKRLKKIFAISFKYLLHVVIVLGLITLFYLAFIQQ